MMALDYADRLDAALRRRRRLKTYQRVGANALRVIEHTIYAAAGLAFVALVYVCWVA